MLCFNVFDASVLEHLQLTNWSDIPGLANVLSVSTSTATNDGHLVLWNHEMVGDPESHTGATAHKRVYVASYRPDRGLGSTFLFHVFYNGRTYRGTHFRVQRFTHSTETIPDIFGNWEDQLPGYTTLTVVSNESTLELLREKLTSSVSRLGSGAKSTLYVSASGGAIQARFFCDEVRIEDVIDFYVAAALAIKDQRRSRMVLGLSYTDMVLSPTVEKPDTDKPIRPSDTYPSVMPIRVIVEEKYGPFEKIWPQS